MENHKRHDPLETCSMKYKYKAELTLRAFKVSPWNCHSLVGSFWPSGTLEPSKDITTMSSSLRRWYGTPVGVTNIILSELSPNLTLTFPLVPTTRPESDI